MSIFIHVGHHKTATTWLQNHVFSQHPGIMYLDPLMAELTWITEIATAHDFDFDPNYYKGLSHNKLSDVESVTTLTSWEGFVGSPLTGAWRSKSNAFRLSQVFPKAKIIIGIRNQLSMTVSLYKQYVHEGGTCNFAQFVTLAKQRRAGHFSLDYLRFDRLLTYYAELFESDAIFVYLYEEISGLTNNFLKSLFLFLRVDNLSNSIDVNVKVNRGMSSLSLGVMRFANSFLSTSRNSCAITPSRLLTGKQLRRFLQQRIDPLLPEPFFSSHDSMNPQIRSYIENYCKDSNRVLQEKFGLPLERNGYPI